MSNWSSGQSSPRNQNPLIPKQEILDFDFPVFSNNNNTRDNVASSSGTSSDVRSTLIGMGFQPSLVNKVIQQKGEDHFDVLLDTLVAYTEGLQSSNSKSSDSLDRLFDDYDVNSPEISSFHQPKEEPDEVDDSKRASLLLMNFTLEEINFAINRLGEDAPIDGLVDFIVASQIAKRLEQVSKDTVDNAEDKNEEICNEILFSTMDKTLRLLEMGFTDTQVSWAIENCGSELPISELADSIITGRIPVKKSMPTATMGTESLVGSVKPEGTNNLFTGAAPHQTEVNVDTSFVGKEPKPEEHGDASFDFETIARFKREENRKGKRPKLDRIIDDSNMFLDPNYYEEKVDPELNGYGIPRSVPIIPRKPLSGIIARPPYFLYGNVGNVSPESWVKISKFLYNVEPEFVNTEHWSALCRNEGYIHNLPSEERFEIGGKNVPMTIQDAMPHTAKWWPSWDARKKLVCIGPHHGNGISLVCDRLTRTLIDSRGTPSGEQQRRILEQCQSLNLVWVGRNKVWTIEPEYLETILGYPLNHTDSYASVIERVECLKFCFQTDTLGYHLSVLKRMYQEGLTMLSIFTGIGGAEMALHRLGVRMKAVVSVESSETKRKIVHKWWRSSGQSGELVQLQDIQKLTSGRLSDFREKYGCFDLVICQNPSSQHAATSGGGGISGFDLSLFCEFVRILQRVRGMVDKNRN